MFVSLPCRRPWRAALAILFVLATPVAQAQVGFATLGKLPIDITTAINNSHEYAKSVVVQPDGKILLGGFGLGSDFNYDFILVRLNSDGSLDTSFGPSGNGKVITSIGNGEDAGGSSPNIPAIALQSDGKILLVGVQYTGSQYNFAVVRYTASGNLDTSFDTDGITTTDFFGNHDMAVGVVQLSSGKILVAGKAYNGSQWQFALARYNDDGSLDTSFDTDGKLTTSFGFSAEVTRMALQSDGKIVLAGYANNNFAVARYNETGSLDTSFDTDGKLTTAVGSSGAIAYSVGVQSDGKIVVGGYASNGTNNDFAVVRYNTGGSLDTDFDTDGIVLTDFGAADYGYDLALQSDDRIVVIGMSINNGVNNDFAVARYNTDGSLDTGFDTDGKVTTAIAPTNEDRAFSVAIQSDSKIVVAGYSNILRPYNGSSFNNDFSVVRYNTNGSLDTGSLTRTITATPGTGNDQGWRVLSMPVVGATRADLEDDVTFTTNAGNVLYTHNGSAYVAVTASGTALTNGRGFLLYLFDSAGAPFTSDKTLDVAGMFVTYNVTVTGLPQSNQWHLLGNPFDAPFDVASMTLTGFQSNVQIWNPRFNSGVGRWEVLPAASTVLPAWQGFFVERSVLNAGATSLTMPYSGRTTGGTFYGKTNGTTRVTARLDLRLALAEAATSTLIAGDLAAIETRPEALEGFDAYDASKLAPLGSTFATLAIGGERAGQPWWHALRSLPSEGMGVVEMPLHIKASTGGSARLSWSSVPAGYQASLRDTRSGTVVDARRDSVYTFALAAATDDSTRFVLRLAPSGATANEAPLAPEAFGVSPVGPSPTRAGAAARLVVHLGTSQHVSAILYDALGRAVATAFDGDMAAGVRQEIALPLAGLAPGAYVVRITGEHFAQSRTLNIVR